MNRSDEVVAERAARAPDENPRRYSIIDGTFPFTGGVHDGDSGQTAYALFDQEQRVVVVIRHDGEARVDVYKTDSVVSWASHENRGETGLIVHFDGDPSDDDGSSD
jgi:hypothetical protein